MKLIGIIREGKLPPDRRTPFTPLECKRIETLFPGTKILVESSDIRCFSDAEYRQAGIDVVDDLSACDVIMGVKEVPPDQLLEGKTYFFFSHTIKKQPYNRKLLQTVLERKIHLVDYETLTDASGYRLLGFGRWAGVVGAYNALYAYGLKHGSFELKRAYLCANREEMDEELKKVKLPAIKIILTGGGRVAYGAKETLDHIGMEYVCADDFLNKHFDEAVCCMIDADQYNKHRNGRAFEFRHFFKHPEEYQSAFLRFARVADMHIACHYWDERAPAFYTKEDMRQKDFNITLVADISCDINGPIASTIRASSIEEPVYGYHPVKGIETDYMDEKAITVMAVDNLPCELPREASEDFGNALIEKVMPSLLVDDADNIIARAAIAKDGRLTKAYAYLQDYVQG